MASQNATNDRGRHYRRQETRPHRTIATFFEGASNVHIIGGSYTTVGGSVFDTTISSNRASFHAPRMQQGQTFVMNNHSTNIDINGQHIRVNANGRVSYFPDTSNPVIGGMDVTVIGGNYYSMSESTTPRGNVHQDRQSGYTNTSFGGASTMHLQEEKAATIDDDGYGSDSTLYEEPPMPPVTYGGAASQNERMGDGVSHDPDSTISDESSRQNDTQYRNKPLPPIPGDITRGTE